MNGNGLLLGDLERIVGEVVGVEILVEKAVYGAAGMCEQCISI